MCSCCGSPGHYTTEFHFVIDSIMWNSLLRHQTCSTEVPPRSRCTHRAGGLLRYPLHPTGHCSLDLAFLTAVEGSPLRGFSTPQNLDSRTLRTLAFRYGILCSTESHRICTTRLCDGQVPTGVCAAQFRHGGRSCTEDTTRKPLTGHQWAGWSPRGRAGCPGCVAGNQVSR